MRVLLATHNKLAKYPSQFSLLARLSIANFDDNQLTALPPMATLQNMEKLTLRNNLIATLPTFVADLAKYVACL